MLRMSPDYINFFQLGFVTHDIDAGAETIKKLYGIPELQIGRDGKTSSSLGDIIVDGALAYIGNVQIELLAPKGGPDAVYRDMVAPEPGSVHLHHCGHLVRTKENWQEMLDAVAESGFATPIRGCYEDMVRYLYVDTRSMFGHYTEFLYFDKEGANIFDTVPRY